jgi:isopenicillin-N N-acyltransferase-like protein
METRALSFTGNHFEIGYQHGEQLASTIHGSVLPFVMNNIKGRGLSQKDTERTACHYEELIRNLFPEILEETRGLAEGAKMDYNAALLILLFWEIHDTIEINSHECSSFVAAGDATADGEWIAAQNSDWPMYMKERGIGQVFRIDVKGRYAFIGRGLAGNLGRNSVIGFNEKGLAFAGSGIHQTRDAGFGFPPLLITRIGLEKCGTVGEFLALLRTVDKWSHAGENVDIVDANGDMARISFSTNRIMITQTKNHFMVSTNHYHNDEMKHFGPASRSAYPSSYARYERIVDLLRDNYGVIDRATAIKIMSDHLHGNKPPEGDKSVCRHGRDRQTVTSMISLPKRKEFWICPGNPCNTEYSCFRL